MCNYVVKRNVFVFLQAMYAWIYYNKRFINIEKFEKWHSRSWSQVLEQKHRELSLETEGSKHIPIFPLVFGTAVKALIKLAIATSKEPISATISFSPFQAIAKYNHSLYVLFIF